MTIGKRINKLRTGKGYTQEYIAEQLGVSRQAVSKWEQDQSSPDTRNLIALSKLLGTSVEYIATGYADATVTDARQKNEKVIRSSRFTSDVFIVLGLVVTMLFMSYVWGWVIGAAMIAFGISLLKQAQRLEKERDNP